MGISYKFGGLIINNMKLNRTIFIAIFSLCVSISGFSQRKQINIPDIPGYVTLKCDFHMHTIFSDGLVWPTIRVGEAFQEGLDAIAITDHIEYRPHKDILKGDHNRSFELAQKAAADAGIILIKGTEITRSLPFGHYNALFITDANVLEERDFFTVIERAVNQGAFIIWNHPGWTQPDEIPIWYEVQQRLDDHGWLHGMEIVNSSSYYPLAQSWCREKDITQIGCSDVHGLIAAQNLSTPGSHRPLTLVFAKERSEESIKEALFAGRTSVYFGEKIYGPAELLAPLAQSIIHHEFISGQHNSPSCRLWISNSSEIPVSLS